MVVDCHCEEESRRGFGSLRVGIAKVRDWQTREWQKDAQSGLTYGATGVSQTREVDHG